VWLCWSQCRRELTSGQEPLLRSEPSTRIYGGINIAMKVPPHQYEATPGVLPRRGWSEARRGQRPGHQLRAAQSTGDRRGAGNESGRGLAGTLQRRSQSTNVVSMRRQFVLPVRSSVRQQRSTLSMTKPIWRMKSPAQHCCCGVRPVWGRHMTF
jgi:hypothetical protein